MAHSVVCVIGAGPCGLTTVKNLVQAGVTDIICHEAQREPGGLWAYSADPQRASVYDAAHTISSKHLSQFRDFPMPEAYPDFPSHRQVLAYMRAYADRFGLDRHIRFGSRVTRARRGVDGGWVIEGENEAGPFRDTADHLIVCSGHHRAAALPQNTEGFNGHRIHSAAFRTTDAYRGKRVLVVGGGNSACDIAAALGRVADHVSLSMRSPQYIIPKLMFGRPVDTQYAKLQRLPAFVRRLFVSLGLRLTVGPYRKYGLAEPQASPVGMHPTLNSDILEQFRHGRVKPRPDVTGAQGQTVRFADGSAARFDAIVHATGYRIDFPFFEDGFCDWADALELPLYLKILPQDVDALYFVGLIQPIGCIWALADRQAELVAEKIAGRWSPPADLAGHIREENARDRRRFVRSRRHAIEVDFHEYKREIGKAIGRARPRLQAGHRVAGS
ncbi:NAD(P)-binding domain-containing protein [Nitratireductor sp. StC3]|uniref:flavin-containing monooxygenase n=1 Tax=Nitratireductor sp. StC3 TaxID=2126741 RepID=UPI000D0DA0A3|nr:NAD(P)-binding domain-containing protein [Nitratireductor sp. StC3]PSM19680.1 monooxygenase [Nitratireductor sp. StC3]